jgi:hypothetical protein
MLSTVINDKTIKNIIKEARVPPSHRNKRTALNTSQTDPAVSYHDSGL